MTNIVNYIFEDDLENAKQTILAKLRAGLPDAVEKEILGEETPDSEDEKIDALKKDLEETEEDDEETISQLKEKIQYLEDVKYGLIFESEDNIEIDLVNKISSQARMMAGDNATYAEGVLYVEFHNAQAASDFTDWLEEGDDNILGYELDVVSANPIDDYEESQDIDLSQITDDKNFTFSITVYLNPDIVEYDEYELEVDDFEEISQENGQLQEVSRKIKINFRGKKRIKMKCTRGFKWDPEKKSCVKITGAQLAKMRKSLRRAVLTKRSKGTSYRTKITRKTRKAKRFRKMMGI